MDDRYRLTTDDEFRILNDKTIDKIAGTYSGTVRIIGGGSSMWSDFKESEVLLGGSDIICVNVAGMVIPNAKHLFSWHWKQISAIKDFRRAEWADDVSIVHSVQLDGRVNHAWHFNGGTSVSGLSCVDLAYLLGYRKISLVGIPMDEKGYFYKPTDNVDMHDKPRLSEIARLGEIYGKILKSFSGNTMKILGHPKEWN